MTQMAQGLRFTEVTQRRQRLEEIVLKAMINHADSREAAEQEIWEIVRKSLPLTWELLEPGRWYQDPIRILVDHVHSDARYANSIIAERAATDPKEPIPGMKPGSPRELQARADNITWLDERARKASPLQRRASMAAEAWSQRREAERVEWQKEQDELDRKRCEASYQNWMRRHGYEEIDGKPVKITAPFYIQVNHKPFWTVCVNEARGWIDRTEHEARFMELVISGVPDDGRPIEYYRRPEEIDALWKRAEAF